MHGTSTGLAFIYGPAFQAEPGLFGIVYQIIPKLFMFLDIQVLSGCHVTTPLILTLVSAIKLVQIFAILIKPGIELMCLRPGVQDEKSLVKDTTLHVRPSVHVY